MARSLKLSVSTEQAELPLGSAGLLAANDAPSVNPYPDFQARMRVCGRWLLAADCVALLAAFSAAVLIATFWRVYTGEADTVSPLEAISLHQAVIYVGLSFIALLWLDSRGHYRQRLPYWETVGHIIGISCAGFIASGFLDFAARANGSRLWVGFSWILFGAFVFAGRALVRAVLHRRRAWFIPALIIGDGPTAIAAERALKRDRSVGYTIVDRLPASTLPNLKKTRAWKQVLMLHDAQYVFVALEGGELERYQAALKSLPRARVPCSIIPPWQGLPSSTLTPHNFMMQDVMMLHDTNKLKLLLPRLTKRTMDILVAATALLFLSPLMIFVSLVVRRDGGPALFRQPRVGRGGHSFQCYKFRSMRIDAEEALVKHLAANPKAAEEWAKFQKLKDDVRVTRFGDFIRRTSIDELPQLLNVLKGDMSLVGPRPCMEGQEKFYAEDFGFYEAVRPGITGPWQVSGRSQLTFKERVALEAWYARNWSLWLDIVIMLKTVPTLLKRGQAF